MSDPTTQSSQISSSQGLNDGHSASSKDSTFSDSFFSSPVSLIQSPQEKKVPLGSDKPPENLATSLHFSSLQSSFSPVSYGNECSGPPEDNMHHSFKDSSSGTQKQDTPIKSSPVSERIKALEALAAKQNDFDRNNGGFLNFKERHYEKSPTESQGTSSCLSFQKKSTEQDSPESPFEVLDEARCENDPEDTVDWMGAHLPPAPDFNIGDPDSDEPKDFPLVPESPSKVLKASSVDAPEVPEVPNIFAVPDQFMDSPIKVTEKNDDDNMQPEQESIEEESEFDLSFLPTAYMWDKQEKANVDTESYQIFPSNQELPPPLAPPAEFETSITPEFQEINTNSVQHFSISQGGLEPAEILDADSSGESDDTVIEEAGSIPAIGNDNPEAEFLKEVKTNQEKQPILVPIINVIETEEQVLSDDEEQLDFGEEDEIKYPITQGQDQESTEQHSECSEVPEPVSVETQQKENTSHPEISCKAELDADYSPKHVMVEDDHESGIFLQSSPDSGGLYVDETEVHLLVSQNSVSHEPIKEPEKPAKISYDIPLNNIYPSSEPSDVESYVDHYASEELALKDQLDSDYFKEIKGEKPELSKSSCLADNQNTSTVVNKSFEENSEDYDETPNEHNLDCRSVPVLSLSDPSPDDHDGTETVLIQSKLPNVDLQDQKAAAETKQFTLEEMEELPIQCIDQNLPVQENTPILFPCFHNEHSGQISELIPCQVTSDVSEEALTTNTKPGVLAPNDVFDRPDSPDTASDTENVEPECSVTTATDSFVEFMRECLKSRQDEECEGPNNVTTDQNPKFEAPISTQSSPAMIMDFEQEHITISALKKLGSSQEQENENLSTMNTVLKPSEAPLPIPNPDSSITSSPTLQTPLNKYQPDVLLLSEIDAVDIWVAEAYHLAEHVLTAVLTHLTVNDLVHWRDPKKSGVVFGVSLLLLLSLAAFSVISVISYLLLALLCVTISFRIYKSVIQAVQKSNEGHPFKALMEKDVTLPPDTFRKHVDVCLSNVNCVLKKMSRLFLVEDLVDSLKLAVVMWLLTYVGAVFNGITILILADILLFSVPPIYEKNKTQIDHYIDIARTQFNTTVAKLQEKLPGSMKRCKAE